MAFEDNKSNPAADDDAGGIPARMDDETTESATKAEMPAAGGAEEAGAEDEARATQTLATEADANNGDDSADPAGDPAATESTEAAGAGEETGATEADAGNGDNSADPAGDLAATASTETSAEADAGDIDDASPDGMPQAEPGAMRPIATPPGVPQDEASSLPDPSPDASALDGLASEEEIDAGSLLALQSLERHRQKKRKKRIIRIVVAAVIAAAIVAALVFFFVTQNQEGAEEEVQVSIDTVVRGDFESSVSASGATQPVNSVAVTPEVDGIIDQVNVTEGQTVNQGDLLFTIRNDELDTKIREAELGVEQARISYNTSDNAVNAAYAAYNAAAAQGFPEEGESQAALQAGIDSSEIELENARISLASAQDAYNEAVANAAKREVHAPITGSIVVMNAISGESTGAGGSQGGSASSLMQIADLSQMTVTVQVNEIDINSVKVGQKAKLTFSAIAGLELEGEVSSIASVATGGGSGDEYSGGGSGGVVTYGVKVLIPTPDPQLKPGMTASISIITESVPDVLLVPAAAVVPNGDGTGTVSVVTDPDTMATEERAVKILAQDASQIAVEGDVKEGDSVAVSSFSGSETDGAEGTGGMAIGMGIG